MRAGNAHQVPFGGTQRATQIAATVSLPPDMHHTGHGQAAAQRANTMRTDSRQQAFVEVSRQTGPVHLQGSHNERRSEEHTSELQSLMRISYAVFCLKKKKSNTTVLVTKNE